VNQTFFDSTVESAYSTIFFADYEDEARRMRYANCGHLPGLLLRADGRVEELDSTGTVLGMFRDWEGELGECQLAPGDAMALYTDGVTEACDAAGEEFGKNRLAAALTGALQSVRKKAPAQAVVEAILAEVQRFSAGEQADDITLIVARCR